MESMSETKGHFLMKRMKRIMLLLVTTGLLGGLNTYAQASLGTTANAISSSSSSSIHQNVKTSYLFVQTAQKAELTNKTLTLDGISENTVWFTDRPVRKFGKVATQDFVNLWTPNSDGTGFSKVAPNAVMTDKSSSKETLQSAGLQGMTLYAPSYNPKTEQLTYRINLQTGTLQKPIELNDVSLFIDDMDSSTEIIYSSTFVPFDSSF
jgi:hypothetical protein